MSVTYSSVAEAAVSTQFILLGCIPCQSFAPHFHPEFQDKDGYTFTALPDFYHEPSNVFLEYKCGELNSKKSFRTADRKLREQYEWRFKKDSFGLSHYAVSEKLWNAHYRIDCLESGWNHSLSKHLIIQRELTSKNYVVVFGNHLLNDAIDKYTRKGLFSLPMAKLEAYLQ